MGLEHRPGMWPGARPHSASPFVRGSSWLDIPQPGGWRCGNQYFIWYELTTKLITASDSKLQASQESRCQRGLERSRSAVDATLGGVWHEARTHSAVAVGDLCVRCHMEVEDRQLKKNKVR
eukprot:5871338-Amphidinium_carterae.2